MKNALVILLVLLSISLKAQHQVITTSNDTINSVVTGVQGDYIYFEDDIRILRDNKINLNNVSVLVGSIPNFRRNVVLKRNPSVKFLESEIPNDYVDDSKVVDTPTDYLFTLTESGFKNNIDVSQDFVVVEFSGITQDKLYNRALSHIHSSFVSPKDVISKIDNESITINGFVSNLFVFVTSVYDVNYTINIQFKDGRIRISAPQLNRMIGQSRIVNQIDEISIRSFFNKKGEPTSRKEIIILEDYFENLLGKLLDSMGNEEDW